MLLKLLMVGMGSESCLVNAGGHIRGDVKINGHEKEQDSFARISGYVSLPSFALQNFNLCSAVHCTHTVWSDACSAQVEQFDIHSPALTVRESFSFSAALRLMNVSVEQREEFVDEVSTCKLPCPHHLPCCIIGVFQLHGLMIKGTLPSFKTAIAIK